MTSLRVALKLSMAEVKPSDGKSNKAKKKNAAPAEKEEWELLDETVIGRKRKASFDNKEQKNKSNNKSNKISKTDTLEKVSEDEEDTGTLSTKNDIEESEKEEEPQTDNDAKNTNIENTQDNEVSNTSELSEKEPNFKEMGMIADELVEDKSGDNAIDSEIIEETDEILVDQEKNENSEKEDEQDDNKNKETEKQTNNDDNLAEEEEENEDDEVKPIKPAVKRRKKRTASILKALEFIFPEPNKTQDPNAEPGSDQNQSGRYQSHRAAAVLAKTKLNSRGSKDENNPISASIDSSAGTKKKDKSAEGASASGNWVQCDKCTKWRSIPGNISENHLPEKWYCTMNIWSVKYNTCSAPEETEEEKNENNTSVGGKRKNNLKRRFAAVETPIEEESPKDQETENNQEEDLTLTTDEKRFTRGRETGLTAGENTSAKITRNKVRTGRWSRESPDTVEKDRKNDDDGDNSETTSNYPGRRKLGQRGVNNNKTYNEGTTGGIAAVNWVQCNKCKKWRKVPESIPIESLPEKWFCSLNTWAVAFARCNARQEQDQEQQGGYSGEGNLGRPRRGASGPLGVVKQVSWVQCERKNCKKWRKVPAKIDINSLPEKWFCEMNTWDLDSASCDVPEASDSEEERNRSASSNNPRTQLILANSKGPGTLSYRRIIFGTDGKMRPCYGEKNKTRYGLFSYAESHHRANVESDVYVEPLRRVNYWWSTAYQEDDLNYLNSTEHTSGRGYFGRRKMLPPQVLDEDGNMGNNDSTTMNKSLIEKNEKSEDFRKNVPAPTYLLDAIRRLRGTGEKSFSGSTNSSVENDSVEMLMGKNKCWPKSMAKKMKNVEKIGLFQREEAECIVVRSCFLLSNTKNYNFSTSTSSKTLTLPVLKSMISSIRFLRSEVEMCRECMTEDILRFTIRRMEMRGEVKVSYSSIQSGATLQVEILIPLAQLAEEVLKNRGKFEEKTKEWVKFDSKEEEIISLNSLHLEEYQGVPLHLRKGKYNKVQLQEIDERNEENSIDIEEVEEENETDEINPVTDDANTNENNKIEQNDDEEKDELEVSAEPILKPFRLQHVEKWSADV